MFEADVEPLFAGHSRHVHQAGAVGSGDIFRPGGDVPAHLVQPHLRRYGGLFYREHPAETAALVGALRLDHLDALYQRQQVLDLVESGHIMLAGGGEPQFAHAMAGVVKAHLVGEAAERHSGLHYVMEEFHDVHGFGGRGAFVPFEQPPVVEPDECSAAHRGGHYVVKVFEVLFELAGQRNRLPLESGIGHGLPAACLPLGVGDVQSQMPQKLPRGDADFRENGIYVAGNE